MIEPAGSPSPWMARDALRCGGLHGLGIGSLLTAWYLAAGDGDPAEQVAPVALAVGGLGLAFTAQLGWLLRGRSLVGARMADLLGMTKEPARMLATAPVAPTLVRVPGRELLHLGSCPMLDGREQQIVDRNDDAGVRPCRICQPHQPHEPGDER